jgi:pimeloyl-ACP methyl ester carboxylesterase
MAATATLTMIPDAAHLTALENPEAFNSAVTQFLGADPTAGTA